MNLNSNASMEPSFTNSSIESTIISYIYLNKYNQSN